MYRAFSRMHTQLPHCFCVLSSQGSTNFSYFPWASASVGYKWGQALPTYCMDERWVGALACMMVCMH